MQAGIITLFPEMFAAISEFGISSRAVRDGLIDLSFWNPRDYTEDKHQTVDDRPYGGGPGMLMKTEPLELAISAAREALPGARVIYLTPQGKPLDQQGINKLAAQESVILICGRYEGFDDKTQQSSF